MDTSQSLKFSDDLHGILLSPPGVLGEITKSVASMSEPTVIAESLPFITRNQLVKLARPKFETVRNAATALWTACLKMRLPTQTYATAALYLQRFLMLNPSVLEQVQLSAEQLNEVACACLVTAFLTEGAAKKIDDAADTLGVASAKVITLQREVLETNAFDFRVHTAPVWVVKLAKHVDLDKETSYAAFQVAIDAHETTAILQFPAHNIAAACIEFAIREELGAKGQNGYRAAPAWDMSRLGLKVVALRTTCRLLLEYYDRCNRNELKTHATVRKSSELQHWLASLQRSAPPLEPDTLAPHVHNQEISRTGTARYRPKRRKTLSQ